VGKYLETGKVSMKAQITYRFDVGVGSIIPFIRVFLAYALWKVLFAAKTEIGGMSFEMMMTYHLVASFLTRLDQSVNMVWDMAEEIREGRFSKYMVRPISPLGHFLAESLAKTLYILLVTLATVAFLAVVMRRILVPPSSLANLAGACLMGFMGLVFLSLLNYLTALLAFKFNDITGWHIMKNNAVDFLAGVLVPLSLLPAWIQDVMRFFPFYYVYYYPASLYLGLKTEQFVTGLIVMAIWIVLLWGLSVIVYHRFRRIYEGVGN